MKGGDTYDMDSISSSNYMGCTVRLSFGFCFGDK